MFMRSIAASLTAVSMIASIAVAQDSQTTRMTAPTSGAMNVYDPVGWFPFIGLTGGYMTPNDSLLTEGTPGEFKIIGSYFSETRRSVVDLGLGVMANSFSQKSTTQNNFINGGTLEAAWRYNATNRWQVGPIVNTFVTGSNRYGSTDPNLTTFGGLQIIKEIPVRGTNMFRVGLKGLTDLSIPGAEVNTVMLDLQWGFGQEQTAPAVSETDADVSPERGMASNLDQAASTPETYNVSNTRRVIEADPDGEAITLRNDERMQFDTGVSDLRVSNVNFVENLGGILASRSDLFDKVEVIGYADQTGTDAINMRVSEGRSKEVAQRLEDGGLAGNKIDTSWKGSSELLYQSLLPEDMQQNRRVDLKFHGVKDQAALEELLSGL